jgi:hypothetical protein
VLAAAGFVLVATAGDLAAGTAVLRMAAWRAMVSSGMIASTGGSFRAIQTEIMGTVYRLLKAGVSDRKRKDAVTRGRGEGEIRGGESRHGA